MLSKIGPVDIDFHGNPGFTWTSQSGRLPARGAEIRGVLDWPEATALSEFIDNPAARVTIAGVVGVLDWVEVGGDLLSPFRGWWLFQAIDLSPEYPNSLAGAGIPVRVSGLYFGTRRRPVMSRSSRARPNPYGITAVAMTPQPFWAASKNGVPYVVYPGGGFYRREYDPSAPHETARLITPDPDWHLGYYLAAVDGLALSVVPVLQQPGADRPGWIDKRGGEARAFDRRTMREVYSDGHDVLASTDLLITNGLARCWVGEIGLVPYLNVEIFVGHDWHAVGCIQLADANILDRARIQEVTREGVTIALAVQGAGDVFVTLNRLEPFFRISNAPAVSWHGTPPVASVVAAAHAAGAFGAGLEGVAPHPEIVLNWAAPADEWATTLWFHAATAAAASAGSAFLTIYDGAGLHVAKVFLDAVDKRAKFVMGARTVQSAPLTYGVGDNVLIGVSFSTVEGMKLSIGHPDGTAQHYTDPAGVDPITAGFLGKVAYLINGAEWGDGDWGDGEWGGGTLYPEGIVSNHMRFDGLITDDEFTGLCTAVYRYDNLPQPEARLVWYAPYEAQPLVVLGGEATGRRVDGATDPEGLTKALVYLDASHSEVGAVVGRPGDAIADQHAQFIAVNEQELRL